MGDLDNLEERVEGVIRKLEDVADEQNIQALHLRIWEVAEIVGKLIAHMNRK